MIDLCIGKDEVENSENEETLGSTVANPAGKEATPLTSKYCKEDILMCSGSELL